MNSNLLTANRTFQEKFSLPLNETLISCTFDKEPCRLDDFDWFFDLGYGKCYFFDSRIEKNRAMFKPGSSNGLSIELFMGQNANQNNIMTSNGFHIYIYNVRILNKA